MESGAYKLLESATQRTLHAHAFSRSSTQASSVLTDLLSRYLTLLTSTCAKYAQHAGRTGLTVHDAVGALNELGVGVEELKDYCATEGKELNRYALYSARRVEDLHEFKSQLSDGLRQDRDDAIPLQYARCPTPLLEDLDSDDEDGEGEDEDEEADAAMEVDTEAVTNALVQEPLRNLNGKRASSPMLPPSPVSPTRKRPRTANWDPPEHIPDFMPPFPVVSTDDVSATPTEPTPAPAPHLPQPASVPLPLEEKASVTLSQSLTTAAASDILVQVPYSQSTLASVPEWHLPLPPPSAPHASKSRIPPEPLEQTLVMAYHATLKNGPRDLQPLNPSRHKVAMALIQRSQREPRWNPADTLFGSVGPCAPRVATIQPSYPVAISGQGSSDQDLKLPPTASRPVAANDRLAPFISQQTSRIPALARDILPPTIISRTSRLTHPPVLHRGEKPLTYGSGIPAPWNANAVGPDTGAPGTAAAKPKETPTTNGKDSPVKPVLPDARLYATWDYESKDYRVPLAPPPRGRNRMGSVQAGSSGVISLSVPRHKQVK